MIRNPIRRRAGTSLVEVLVGFGILGIGVTSVITLFPFSALTIGQALRDDRTTTCAIVADGEIRHIHQQVVEAAGASTEPYYVAMDNPALAGVAPPSGLPSWPQPGPSEPSYPVYVDPMGFYARPSAPMGDPGVPTYIPRVNFSFILNSPPVDAKNVALRFCSLMDSLTFNEDGAVPNNYDMREQRYNFAWMLQRPANRDRYTTRVQVVVYNRRTHLYAPPGGEVVYPNVTFTPGETALVGIPSTAEIRKGTWVMDAGNMTAGLRHAEFYRVLSVTDLGTSLALELHKPIKRPDGQTLPYAANLVVMPGVADVYERPFLTASHQ